MEEELSKKLLADLTKSGFGSEMRAIREFLKKGWWCGGGFHYFDEDENVNRETDIRSGKVNI